MTPDKLMQIESYLLDRKKPDYELSGKIMEACEKQIPRKVTNYLRDNKKHIVYECMCPNCECFHREFYPFAYCNHCGQALDWSDAEC